MFRTLMFHEIRPDEELYPQVRPIEVADGYQDALPLPLFNSLAHFQQQIDFLKTEGYYSLTLQEVKDYFLKKASLPKNSVLITFDDCFQSMKKYAYPVLKEADFRAVAFFPSGWLYTESSNYQPDVSKTLAHSELTDMDDVFEYANHTSHFHQRKGMTAGRSMWETATAFTIDLQECNHFVEHQDVFAYPFGLYDQSTIDTLQKNGFVLGFTITPGINTQETTPMELRRDMIPATMPIEEFKKLMRNEENGS